MNPPRKRAKVRLDLLLVERGLVASRTRAQARIMAGDVFVEQERVDKAGAAVRRDAAIEVRGDDNPFVSRGGLKLEHALSSMEVDVDGVVAIDVGASTGGFTDCLLQRGARKVFAVDVGYGQLAWKLRSDPRVVNLERTNIRKLDPAALDEPVDFAVADCSFISLTKVLPSVLPLLAPQAQLVVLIKPQFEVGKGMVGKGGVVRDPELRRGAIESVQRFCEGLGLEVRGGIDSATHGPKGNVEYLLWLER